MLKLFAVVDVSNGFFDEFFYEDDAIKCANEIISEYKEEAVYNGEWPDEIEHVAVYKKLYNVKEVKQKCNDNLENNFKLQKINEINETF
jgi:hypothetical protein